MNPKKVFVDGDGVWATDNADAQFPQLYTQSVGGWSGAMRGQLNDVVPDSGSVEYLGKKEVFNNWKDLSTAELAELGLDQVDKKNRD